MTNANETPNANPETPPVSEQEVVTLTKDQYAEMLDYVTTIEGKLLEKETTPKTDPLDDILAKTKQTPAQPPQQVNLDDMSNTQLVHFILGEINNEAVGIRTELETVKVLREIDKCEAKYEDFHEYVDQIYELGRKNPTLSIEKAYKLAKAEKGEAPKASGPQPRNLPPRPDVLRTVGENPSRMPSSQATRPSRQDPVDLRSAAEKAWDELNKE